MGEPVWWTEDRKKQLMELWDQYSNSQIGAVIGCSRNAVSGAAHRLGLKKEPKKASKSPRPRQRKKLTEEEKAIRRKPKLMADIIKGEDLLPLLDSIVELRSDECAYPYGVMSFKFCGRPRDRGSFCEAHAQLCYQPPKQRSHVRPFFRISANGR
jgi:GcrA cell cycle regulator